jgi:hypothetical protein
VFPLISSDRPARHLVSMADAPHISLLRTLIAEARAKAAACENICMQASLFALAMDYERLLANAERRRMRSPTPAAA